MKTMAELVNELFSTHRRPDGREYTCSDVTRALDGALDPSYLARLRKGKIENPTKQTLLLLCRFFSAVGSPVEPNYFFPELALHPHHQDPSLTEADADPLRLALRSAGLSPAIEEKLAALIWALQRGQS